MPQNYLQVLQQHLAARTTITILEESHHHTSSEAKQVRLRDWILPSNSTDVSAVKLRERLIANRLRWWMEDNGLYTKFQFGFRKRRSCQDHRRNSQSAINNKQFTLSVVIDLEKAFDLVWHNGLLFNMEQVGLRGNVFKFAEDFLKDRSIQVRVGAAMLSTYFLECLTAVCRAHFCSSS